MSIIPRYIQRRLEQRWVSQFGPLVIPSVPKNVGLMGSPVNVAARGKSQRKPRRVESAGSKSAVTTVIAACYRSLS